MKNVVLESPYAGNVEENVAYAKRCVADSLKRGEAPIASHLLYPGILDDSVPEQRRVGLEAGHAWIQWAAAMVVYTDRGISPGMKMAIVVANAWEVPIEYRKLEE